MNRFVPKRKYVVFCLLSLVFGVVPAFGGSGAENPGEVVERLRPPLPMDRTDRGDSMTAYYDRRAYEAYEKRNAEIVPWVEGAAPLNTDNAALLYYQAFLLRPDLNWALNSKLYGNYEGAEYDIQIRTYMGHCLQMIELVETASRIPHCIWGTWQGVESGSEYSVIALRSELDYLSRILLMDARILAANGHYRAALERCLTVRRLARHLSEDSRLYLIAHEPNVSALRTVQHVLGVMPLDVDILTWFRGQLAVVRGPSLSFADRLQAEVKYYLNQFRTIPNMRSRIKNLLIEGAESEQAREKARNFTDEQLLLYIREVHEPYLDSIFKIVDSGLAYEQKCAQMDRLINELEEEYGSSPLFYEVTVPIGMLRIVKDYSSFQVKQKAHINGLKAAVEVYLNTAETGNLPDELPDGLPKDPFSGRDFVYEKTNEGFVLRSQSEDFPKYMNKWLEFKIRK